MTRRTLHVTVGILAASALFFLAGCANGAKPGHETMAAQSNGHAMACQNCYDEAKTISRQHGKPGALTDRQIIRKHMCESCNTEVTSYRQDGVAMIKCAKCAPEGVACDRCAPPKSGS